MCSRLQSKEVTGGTGDLGTLDSGLTAVIITLSVLKNGDYSDKHKSLLDVVCEIHISLK